VNEKGPRLRAVLEVSAAAVLQAKLLDEQRQIALSEGKALPTLHGIPILLKDNIATKSPEGLEECMDTTAGSFALLGCLPAQDAMVTQKLRKAGAIILGKANMVRSLLSPQV
jgi:amidase